VNQVLLLRSALVCGVADRSLISPPGLWPVWECFARGYIDLAAVLRHYTWNVEFLHLSSNLPCGFHSRQVNRSIAINNVNSQQSQMFQSEATREKHVNNNEHYYLWITFLWYLGSPFQKT